MKLNLTLLLASLLFSFSAYAEFHSEDEVSTVQTGGNTDLKTYLLKSKNSYQWTNHVFGVNGSYTYGESSKLRSAERWDAMARFDRALDESLGVYLSEMIEANRFAGIERRYNSDLGLKYTLLQTETNTTAVELGYRYSIEKRKELNSSDLKDSKGRAFGKTEHKFNTNVSFQLAAEYLPNFSRSEDYLMNLDASTSVVLNQTFSLKISYLWSYDNLPAALKGKHDYTLSTGLLAKF
jgi:putative salt-induced outer membrane protein